MRLFHSVNERDLGTTGDIPYTACIIDPWPNGAQKVVANFTEGCFSFPNICTGSNGQGRLGYRNTMDPEHSDWKIAAWRTAAALKKKGYESRFMYGK